MTITTSAIQANGNILPQYTCDGEDCSPPLTFSEIPVEAKSLALIMDDPDSPGGTFTHWILYDMSPSTLAIPEKQMPQLGKAGKNDFGKVGYGGPCPASGTHRYRFRLFALDTMLNVPEGVSRSRLEAAMQGHVIAQAELAGRYARS